MLGDLWVCVLVLFFATWLIPVYMPSKESLSRHWLWLVQILLLWILYAFFFDLINEEILGIRNVDSIAHDRIAHGIAANMEKGDWSEFYRYLGLGNGALRAAVAMIYYLTGGTAAAVAMLNVFLAFWGSLILVSHIHRETEGQALGVLPTFLIACAPSLLFWTTAVLKEGAMYWAICVMIGASGKHRKIRLPLLVAAICVGGVFRPHIMLLWAAGIGIVGLFGKGRKMTALLACLVAPLLLIALDNMTGFGMTIEGASRYLDGHYAIISGLDGSAIRYGGRPIFFVSGVLALFFRPFPWEVTSAAQALASAEIWLYTGLIAYNWFALGREKRASILKQPAVQLSLIVCLEFAVVYSWMGNEGLLARQRLQAFPALLILLAAAWRMRRTNRDIALAEPSLPRGRLAPRECP